MRLLLAAGVALALLPTAADASTVTVRDIPGGSGEEVYYLAGAGETNVLEVAYAGNAGSVTVTDPGATITAGAGCTSLDEHSARCTPLSATYLQDSRADLGDRDDKVTTTRPGPAVIGGVVADGGPGDDTLDGGAGSDELNGGGGTDTLLGGGGHDVITDGDTDDAANADVMDGGEGAWADEISYAGRTRDVTVDLTATTAGAEGENDQVKSFAHATGGDGDDRLLGDDDENDLVGNGGDDVIKARGSDDGDFGDLVLGGAGDDRLYGGDDDDSISPGPGTDRLSCGSGNDRISGAERDEILSRHCERLSYSFGEENLDGMSWRPVPKAVSARVVRQELECPSLEETDGTSVACSGTIRYRQIGGGQRLLGRGSFSAETEKGHFRVKMRLTRLGRRLSNRTRGVGTNAFVDGKDIPSVAWGFHLYT
jgi:Ca2+-binding RTX toxin-like protein